MVSTWAGRLLIACLLSVVPTIVGSTPTTPRTTCSCQSPASVPLAGLAASPSAGVWLNNSYYSDADPTQQQLAAAAAAAAASAAAAAASTPYISSTSVDVQAAAPSTWSIVHTGFCGKLPSAAPGQQCGAGIAICKPVSADLSCAGPTARLEIPQSLVRQFHESHAASTGYHGA